MSSSSQVSKSTGKPAAIFSHTRKSSQESHSDRESISSGHQPLQGKDETFFKFSDHMLAEAKSEVRKQGCRADILDSSIRDLQRQLDSNRFKALKNLEKSKPDFMKNSLSEKGYFEKLRSEVFMKWEN